MDPATEREELARAFLEASDFPPVTKDSLGELDIQSIIYNPKLRHDINYDRDLSFRPNLDGTRGQQKHAAARTYWLALKAELILYARYFQGTPPLPRSTRTVQCMQRRIPKMFETLREVLKSLVPARDHGRVDEHLDVPKLMQEIERGVCDLLRLSESIAHLLKEHCAPMRDVWVDEMVGFMRNSMETKDTGKLAKGYTEGLSHLLGILEAMKLDVANHQIRNLKTLLIEDSVNFERHYHLDRIVNRRSRVNVEASHQWFESALTNYQQICMPRKRNMMLLQLEVFVRVTISALFSKGPLNLPDTFYMDQDRLLVLQTEIEDLVCFEMCFVMLDQLVRGFGNHESTSPGSRQVLRSSLDALLSQSADRGLAQWMKNSEAISDELVRQARIFSSCPPTHDLDLLQRANTYLRSMLKERFYSHAADLESYVVLQVLALVNRHIYSPPMELFNSLVPATISHSSTPPPLFGPTNTLHSQPAPFSDISNRITHILLLHWRIWGPIAYVQDEQDHNSTTEVLQPRSSSTTTTSSSPPPPPRVLPPPPAGTNLDPAVVTSMKAGEPPDNGQEALEFAHRPPSYQ
ncbi:hypothetical protein K491DRAFT_700520 [Lophiostoma macrostomum CBS 122681]|uniref:Tcp11-domain-containing protein n=1 Tax=Lophiostoma macrostomum CBS 122681 TaxID=1314788 RepID=A0A6A6TSE9_9PLEO|nr:hypothetical protein K491DRAFT_700520 [Lophiostoma macrostomum CBS 122681]